MAEKIKEIIKAIRDWCNTKFDTEKVRAETKETELTNAITAEKDRATQAEKTLQENIDNIDITPYTHPTTSGYKHIPTGGTSGQILGYAGNGTAKWIDATSVSGSTNNDVNDIPICKKAVINDYIMDFTNDIPQLSLGRIDSFLYSKGKQGISDNLYPKSDNIIIKKIILSIQSIVYNDNVYKGTIDLLNTTISIPIDIGEGSSGLILDIHTYTILGGKSGDSQKKDVFIIPLTIETRCARGTSANFYIDICAGDIANGRLFWYLSTDGFVSIGQSTIDTITFNSVTIIYQEKEGVS